MHFNKPAHQLFVRILSGVLLRALKLNIIYHKDMNTEALRDEAPRLCWSTLSIACCLLVSNLRALNVCEGHMVLEVSLF